MPVSIASFEQLLRLGDLFGLENRRHANVHASRSHRTICFLSAVRYLASRLAGHVGLFRVGASFQSSCASITLSSIFSNSNTGVADPVTGLEQRDRVAPMLLPAQLARAAAAPSNLGRRERHERLDGDREVGAVICKRDVQDRLHAFGIGLGQLPRLGSRPDTCCPCRATFIASFSASRKR